MSNSDYSSDCENITTKCNCNRCINERRPQYERFRYCQCKSCQQKKNIRVYDHCNCYRCNRKPNLQHKCHNDHQTECNKGKTIVITIN